MKQARFKQFVNYLKRGLLISNIIFYWKTNSAYLIPRVHM